MSRETADTADTVFPVGHYGGTCVDGRFESHLVRVGRRLEQLTVDEFGIWVLSHGLADVGRSDWTRDEILGRAADAEISDAGTRLDELLDRGLLASVPTRPDRVDESVAFATAYRLGPLLVGLGAVPERPDRYAIGVPGVGTAAWLDADCYRLWQWAAVAPTLWRLCEDRVDSAGGGGLENLVDPARVLTDVLGELRVLVLHGCAYLDVVRGSSEEVPQ